MAKKTKRRGRVRRSKRKANGAARAVPDSEQQLQVGTAPGIVRVQFERPIERINLTVAQAFELSHALFKGAKDAAEKAVRKQAGMTPAPPVVGEAPDVVGPDGEVAPRPAVLRPRAAK